MGKIATLFLKLKSPCHPSSIFCAIIHNNIINFECVKKSRIVLVISKIESDFGAKIQSAISMLKSVGHEIKNYTFVPKVWFRRENSQ